jgi:hypothetical protein
MIQLNLVSFEVAYKQLEEELAIGKEPLYKNPQAIPIKHINTAQSVLQPRGLNDISASEEHIKVLVKAIEQNKPSYTLDPITIWWSGSNYRVIDGHHRLEAYKQVSKSGMIKLPLIPVQLFEGTLKGALLESTKLNSKDKLPMSSDDKFDRAWKLVCLESYTINETANVCGIGSATISRMRTSLNEYQAKFPQTWREEVFRLTWKRAMMLDQEDHEFDEEWEIKLAKEWAQRLHKAFGVKLSSQPSVAALALQYYSQDLVPSLIGEWRKEIKEFYEDEDRAAAEGDF